jgi:hypothetical protein
MQLDHMGAIAKCVPESIARRFVIKRRLGAGSFGTVYEAFDRHHNVEVALKALHRLDPCSVFRFKNEFRVLANIVHRNLVTLHELFAVEGQWFYTMDLIRGVDFTSYIRGDEADRPEGRAIDFDRVRRALGELIEAVDACHRAGCLHRDIKPSNILVENNGHVVLLDFGLSVGLDAIGTQGHLAGTPGYMGPELLMGQPPTEATDWYAVGVVIFEALTGRRQTEATTLLRGRATASGVLEALPSAPVDLHRLCMRLLAADPNCRPSGAELVRLFGSARSRATTSLPAAKFVGRAASLQTLHEAWATAKQGRTVAVRVYGSSGIGKTTLVRHFKQLLTQDQFVTWLEGRCYEHESVPFKALDVLLDDLSRHLAADPDLLTELDPTTSIEPLLRCFPSFARLEIFNGVDHSCDGWSPSELRERAFAALRAFLAALALRGGLAIFLDDVHWSDPDSAAALRSLLTADSNWPIMLITCHRSGPQGEGEMVSLLSELAREQALTSYEIQLAPLRNHESEQLVKEWIVESDIRKIETIAREGAGNPFFLQELSRQASSRSSEAGAWSLTNLIDSRLKQLPPLAREIVELVAIAGRPLPVRLLQGRADQGAEVRNTLERLRRVRLLQTSGGRQGDRVDVYHDRIRQAVRTLLSAERKSVLHRCIAERIEEAASATSIWSVPMNSCCSGGAFAPAVARLA